MNKTELLNEAKKAKSLEELKQMATGAGIPLTEEEAKFYFSLVNQQEGELSLDELDAATGGEGGIFVGQGDKAPTTRCAIWRCRHCGRGAPEKAFCECGAGKYCYNCVDHNLTDGNYRTCSKFVDDGTGC